MRRLRKQEAGEAALGYLPADPQLTARRGGTWDIIPEPSPSPEPSGSSSHSLPALSCSSSSASDFICFLDNGDYDTSHFQALFKGYPRCGFCQGNTAITLLRL